MAKQIKILVQTVIEYGPQLVTAGQVMSAPDTVANGLIAAGIAALDVPDAPTQSPLSDANNDEQDAALG